MQSCKKAAGIRVPPVRKVYDMTAIKCEIWKHLLFSILFIHGENMRAITDLKLFSASYRSRQVVYCQPIQNETKYKFLPSYIRVSNFVFFISCEKLSHRTMSVFICAYVICVFDRNARSYMIRLFVY